MVRCSEGLKGGGSHSICLQGSSFLLLQAGSTDKEPKKRKRERYFIARFFTLTIQITFPLYADAEIILLESSVAVTTTVASITSVAAAAVSTAAATTVTATASIAATAISTTAAATGAISTATAAAVTTAITATVAASVSATAGTASTAATSVLLVGFFHGHFLAADGSVVECFNSLAGFCVVGHIYKPKAFTFSCFPIHHNFREIHRAVQFEHLFQVYVIKIIRKTCYKKLHADRFKR